LRKHIKDIIGLQTIDSEIQQLDQEIARNNAALEEQRASIEKRQATIASLEASIAAGEARKRALEAEAEDENARIKDRQVKLMNVQTNREYQSLLREIEDAKKANNEREEEIVLLMEQAETYQSKIAAEQAAHEEEEKQLAEDLEQVGSKTATLNAQKTKIAQTRDEQAKKITANHIRKYELLKAKRNGIAVVAAANGVCQGCYMNIPPQMYNDLLREQELLSCPTCNRMLYNKAAE